MSQYIPILVGSEFGSDLGRMADEGRQVLPPIRLWDWLNTWRSCNIVTVFKARLKDNVKDSLVHHDKLDKLYKLVKLAT